MRVGDLGLGLGAIIAQSGVAIHKTAGGSLFDCASARGCLGLRISAPFSGLDPFLERHPDMHVNYEHNDQE